MSLPSEFSRMYLATNHGFVAHHVAWIPTSDGSWKLNFAGLVADRKSGIAGAGFILRDANAIFKAGCAEPVENCDDIITAELMALFHGLEAAMNQGVEYLEIEGDYGLLFQVLHRRVEPVSPVSLELLDRCIRFIQAFRDAKVRQVNKHSNVAANKMAAIGVGEEEPIFWFNVPPPEISEILVDDVIGRWVPASEV